MSMETKTTQLILVRHGETEMNRLNLYFGQLDPSLNETGRKQLMESEKALKKYEEKIDRIYCSPLKRCVESLELLKVDKKLRVSYEEDFKEINFGVLEGKTYKEILAEHPEVAQSLAEDWQAYKVPKGESLVEVQMRSVKRVEEILEENKGKAVLLVAHSGVIRAILTYYLYGNLDGYWKIKIDNGGISKITRLPDGFTLVDYMNRL